MKKRVVVSLLLVLLVAGAVALAGCVADDVDPQKQDGGRKDDGPDGAEDGEEAAKKRYRFSAADPSVDTFSASGDYESVDYCFPVGCIVGDPEERFDLASIVPVGLPVRIDALFEHDHSMMGNIAGYLETDGAHVLHHQMSGEYGKTQTLALLVRPDPSATVEWVVRPNFPDAAAGRSWSVEVTATVFTDIVPPGFPTIITVRDAADPPVFAVSGAGAVSVLLWGPDDSFVGRYSDAAAIKQAIRDNRAKGDYVILAPLGGPGLIATANGSAEPAALKPLRLVREVATFQKVDSYGSAEWGFEVAAVPVAVGLTFRAKEGYAFERFVAELAGPKGALLKINYDCGLCLSLGSEWTFHASAAPGADGAVPGDYAVKVTLQGLEFEAAHHLVRYER